jgi:hypothetical protein
MPKRPEDACGGKARGNHQEQFMGECMVHATPA